VCLREREGGVPHNQLPDPSVTPHHVPTLRHTPVSCTMQRPSGGSIPCTKRRSHACVARSVRSACALEQSTYLYSVPTVSVIARPGMYCLERPKSIRITIASSALDSNLQKRRGAALSQRRAAARRGSVVVMRECQQ